MDWTAPFVILGLLAVLALEALIPFIVCFLVFWPFGAYGRPLRNFFFVLSSYPGILIIAAGFSAVPLPMPLIPGTFFQASDAFWTPLPFVTLKLTDGPLARDDLFMLLLELLMLGFWVLLAMMFTGRFRSINRLACRIFTPKTIITTPNRKPEPGGAPQASGEQ